MGTRTVSQSINLQADQTSKYITRISSDGITVHPEIQNSGSNYIHIDGNGLIIKNQEGGTPAISTDIELANFTANGATIGKTDGTESYMALDYRSLKMVDKNGNPFLYVSDLRDKSGTYGPITQEWVADGVRAIWQMRYNSNDLSYKVYLDDVEIEEGGPEYLCKELSRFYFNEAPERMSPVDGGIPRPPASGTKVKIVYYTDSDAAKAFTIGIRNPDSMVGPSSFVVGMSCEASGAYSYAEGYRTSSKNYGAHSEGGGTVAAGEGAHAEGIVTKASGYGAHAEGVGYNNNEYGEASGWASHVEGHYTIASGEAAHAEGGHTQATGYGAHAEGGLCIAKGSDSHAEGVMSCAYGENSHAEGYSCWAYGDGSHAEGHNASARGDQSHAEGIGTYARGENSHTSGRRTYASGKDSFTIGRFSRDEDVCYTLTTDTSVDESKIYYIYSSYGYYNPVAYPEKKDLSKYYELNDENGTKAFTIGNGAKTASSNALTVDWEGNVDVDSRGSYSVGGTNILELVYPVGSIYMSVNSTNPGTLFGGTWERIQDRFLLAAGSTYSAGSANGQASVKYTPAGTVANHTLNVNEIPVHYHAMRYSTGSTSGAGYAWTGSKYSWTSATESSSGMKGAGGGQPHNHGFTGTQATIATMPPYLTVYMWKRTA